MIRIDRSALTPPPVLTKRSQEATQMILYQSGQLGKQQRLEFKSQIWSAYRSLLAQLFHEKCAFCESPLLATGFGDFEHYRPKATVNEDAKHPGYFWLAYDWKN